MEGRGAGSVEYQCGDCEGKVTMKVTRPDKVVCSKCGSRMVYKTRPATQLMEVSTD